jgi:hypothetical protein
MTLLVKKGKDDGTGYILCPENYSFRNKSEPTQSNCCTTRTFRSLKFLPFKRRYQGILRGADKSLAFSISYFLFAAQPKEFFLDGLKKSEQQSTKPGRPLEPYLSE